MFSAVTFKLKWDGEGDDKYADTPAAEKISGVTQHAVAGDDVAEKGERMGGLECEESEHDREEEVQADAHVPASRLKFKIKFVGKSSIKEGAVAQWIHLRLPTCRPRVRIPCTPSTLYSIWIVTCWNDENKQKRSREVRRYLVISSIDEKANVGAEKSQLDVHVDEATSVDDSENCQKVNV